MELQAYLEKLVAISHCPVTFSGDVPNALSRWLVRSAATDGQQPMGTEPFLDTKARILHVYEPPLLEREEAEANWRQYTAEMIDRYQEVNTPRNLFASAPNKYMYALNNVYCEQERDVVVNLITYFPTPIRLWINGELVITGNHDCLVKDYFFMYRFREGGNTVLFESPLSLQYPLTHQEIVIKLHPVSALLENGKDFIDEDLLPFYKKNYTVFPEKFFYQGGDELCLVALPRYGTGERDEIRLSISAVGGDMLYETQASASVVNAFSLPADFEGLLRISADRLVADAGEERSGEAYVFVGDSERYVQRLLQQAADRSDCDQGVLTTVKELMELPQAFKSLNQYVPGEVYNTILPVLAKFIEYAGRPEYPAMQGYQEVFGSTFTVYEPQPNSDRLSAYTLTLPDGYDPSLRYPLVVYFHDAQARSFPMDLPWAHRSSTSQAIIANIVGIGRLNYADDVNVIEMIGRIAERYPVDRNRIHLIGFCTGGPKTYRIAMQAPDVFAGMASLIGDMRLSINEPEYDLIDNLTNMKVLGLMSTENWFFNSTRKLNFLKRLPKAETFMFHGFMHNEFNALLNSRKLIGKLLEHKRDPFPREVKLVPFEPCYNKSYWVKVEEVHQFKQRTCVTASILSANRIDIQMDNVARLRLMLSRSGMELDDCLEISVNGALLQVALADHSHVDITLANGEYQAAVCAMSAEEFDLEYHAIGVDKHVMGIKRTYLSSCTIVKPAAAQFSRRSLAGKLAYLLQNPIRDRYIYYKYDACEEEEFDWEQGGEGSRSYVLPMDTSRLGPKQQKLLESLGVQADGDRLIYRDWTFSGVYFAFIACRLPENPQRLFLIVAYNDQRVESEMITCMNGLESNPLFYNDAVVFHEGEYYGFRNESKQAGDAAESVSLIS